MRSVALLHGNGAMGCLQQCKVGLGWCKELLYALFSKYIMAVHMCVQNSSASVRLNSCHSTAAAGSCPHHDVLA
jgi:hypothetical protein